MQIFSIPHIALRVKSRAKSVVCVLLCVVAILAPAVSMANVMLHLPSDLTPTVSKAISSDVIKTHEMKMAGESCHETEKGSLGFSQNLKHADSSSESECCESYCECSVSGCSSQVGIVDAVFGAEYSSDLFFTKEPSHYTSVSLSPQSPPPTL